jgi:hypothetical protein
MLRALLALTAALSFQHTFAAAMAYNCDDGDYHLLIVAEKGAPTINAVVCEFAYCENYGLHEIKRISGAADSDVYDLATKDQRQTLVVKYKNNDVVEVVSTTEQTATNTYQNCVKLN